MKRGQVYWADLGEPAGSTPAFRRPVVIVQDDLLTESRLATVMIVPLTSNLGRAEAIGNVLLEPSETGLRRASVALVCQVMTLDKDALTEVVGALPRRAIRKLDEGIKLALGLSV